MYQTNLAEKIENNEEALYREEKNIISKFREAYAKGDLDKALKYANGLDSKFYKQGIDLLEI